MKTEDEAVVRRITTEHKWKLVSEMGFPNQLIGAIDNNGAKYGAVRIKRARPFGDWAANLDALVRLQNATSEGKVTMGVVLLYDSSDRLVAVETIQQVMENLRGEEPEYGRYGEFFWLDAAFKSAKNRPLSWDNLAEAW
jgi:hypothetical protein